NQVAVRIVGVPFQKVRVRIPEPPFGAITGETWLFSHTGDHASGVELDLGSCTNAETTVELGYLQVQLDSDPPTLGPRAEGSIGAGEVQSCTGTWMPAEGTRQNVGAPGAYVCMAWQYCYEIQPYNLYPADGAKNVPPNVTLSWTGGDFEPCSVDIGTNPSC